MTLLTTPERRRQKPGPKIKDQAHYPCGDPRTPENTVTRIVRGCESKTCRACENAYQRARRANGARPGMRCQVALQKPIAPARRARRASLTTPAIQRVIEEARVEFNRLYGTPDSTDPAQLSADFGGEG